METFSALLAICAGNSPVPGEFPAQRPVTLSFDVFFDLRLNKRLCKQSWGCWFETPLRPLWRHRNDLDYMRSRSTFSHLFPHTRWLIYSFFIGRSQWWGIKTLCGRNKHTSYQNFTNPATWHRWRNIFLILCRIVVTINICILLIITRAMGELKTHSPIYGIMDKWENMFNLTHILDKIYLTGIFTSYKFAQWW